MLSAGSAPPQQLAQQRSRARAAEAHMAQPCLSATAGLLLLLAAFWLGRSGSLPGPATARDKPIKAVSSELEPEHHKHGGGRKRGGGHRRGGRKHRGDTSTKHGRRRHRGSDPFNRSAALDEQFEARLHLVESLPQEPGAWVECGHHLAATCAACVTSVSESGVTECRGECSWNEARSECVAMYGSAGGGPGGMGAPAPHRPTFLAQHHEFDASNQALWVLTPSMVGAVGLSLALMGSAAAQTHQCRGVSEAASPAASQALCGTDKPGLTSGEGALRNAALGSVALRFAAALRTRPPCTCEVRRTSQGGAVAAAGSGQWLLSPLSPSAAEASAAAAAAAGVKVLPVALLREPEELLQQEQLASLEVRGAVVAPASHRTARTRHARTPHRTHRARRTARHARVCMCRRPPAGVHATASAQRAGVRRGGDTRGEWQRVAASAPPKAAVAATALLRQSTGAHPRAEPAGRCAATRRVR